MSPEERKEKARWQRIFRVYGITKEQYDQLDKGHCPVCERSWSTRVRPAIDHDHTSGTIRGLLCLYCNRYRVGRFRDWRMVQRIVDYLRLSDTGWTIPKKKPKRKRKVKK